MNQALLGTQSRPELTCVQNGATTASVIPHRSFTLTAVGVMHGATALGPAATSLLSRPSPATRTPSVTRAPHQSRRESWNMIFLLTHLKGAFESRRRVPEGRNTVKGTATGDWGGRYSHRAAGPLRVSASACHRRSPRWRGSPRRSGPRARSRWPRQRGGGAGGRRQDRREAQAWPGGGPRSE